MKEVLMRKRVMITGLLLIVLFILSAVAISLAENSPSELIVVRATDNSLWKAICDGTTCSEFTSFPGRLASTPTVIWDEAAFRYVVWGRASDGSIWRGTFSRWGNFLNDWVSIPGNTPSPIGAAGSILKLPYPFNTAKSWIDVSTISTDCSNMTELTHVSVVPLGQDMIAIVFADGIYDPSLANKWVKVCLSTTSGGSSDTCDSWAPVLESSSVGPQYEGERRYALNMDTPLLDQNQSYSYYLKACRESGATGTLYWDGVIARATPYY